MRTSFASPPDGPGSGLLIPARTERQAMDWSLALASQEIACVIRPPVDQLGWTLEVDPRDVPRALHTLRAYHAENRHHPTALTPAVGELVFHWGVLAWCLLMLVIFLAADAPGNRMAEAGEFVTRATVQGDWWRPLTATFLHAGPDHLAANLTTGFLLVGLAMGRFGVGPALWGTLLAGTAGNLLAWWWRAREYTGLGASGVVMAALGMLAVSLAIDTRAHRISMATLLRGVLGGVLLFILLGTAPQSDVLAHTGGFLAGLVAAAGLGALPARVRTSVGFDVACAVGYLVTGLGAWFSALR